MNQEQVYNPYGGNSIYSMPQQPQGPLTRRQRLGRRLLDGKRIGGVILQNWFASYAVAAYAIALVMVNVMFSGYATEWYFGLFGIIWVVGFFYGCVYLSRSWSVLKIRKSRFFEKKLFWIGLMIRIVYAIFIYYFYISMNGKPYEFAAMDSDGYMESAKDFAIYFRSGTLWPFITEYAKKSFSDMGYPLFAMLQFYIFEEDTALLVLRLVHAFFGAYTSVLIYRLTRRTFDESVARIAAIFCMLHPVLICYVGVTLKEVVMTWLLVLFVDLSDRLLRNRRYTFATVFPVVIVGFLLFMFRTVLGLVAFMAVFFTLVMIDTKLVSWGRKIVVGIILAGVIVAGASDNIMREIDAIRQTDFMKEQETTMTKRYGSEKQGEFSGNRFANYAGAAVFAPMIFTIPFPTMVATEGQEDMRLIHGGNWMRNVMSGFVILAMFMLLLTGEWRRYTLPLAVLLGYFVVLVFSSFAHSLRFHIPVIPFEMIYASYAIVNLRKKHKNWYLIWCIFMVVTCIGWNWIKLRGRGL